MPPHGGALCVNTVHRVLLPSPSKIAPYSIYIRNNTHEESHWSAIPLTVHIYILNTQKILNNIVKMCLISRRFIDLALINGTWWRYMGSYNVFIQKRIKTYG